MNLEFLLAVGGVVIIMVLRMWAYTASPRWLLRRNAVASKGTYRRRLLLSYVCSVLFVTAWLVHAYALHRRVDELMQHVEAPP